MFDDTSAYVTINTWEYLLLVFYMAAFVIYFGRRKRLAIGRHPEYRYYLPGLFAHVLGALCLIWIYIYYYKNGDVISFYKSALPLAKLATHDPARFVQAFFLPNDANTFRYLFDQNTGYPLGYIYYDTRTYFLVKIVALLMLPGLHSIILTSALTGVVSYGGVWNLYRMLVRYYPRIPGRLAFAVLFFPSSVFWGSGMLKDTFTFSAVCWFVYGLDQIFFLRRALIRNWANVLIAAWLMVAIKPYVFMTIFPATLLWLLYNRVQRIRNALVRVMILPSVLATLAGGTLIVMGQLGDRLGKFSLDSALQTVVINQQDLTRSEHYGSNYFDIGEVEATWASVLSKFPQATFAGLFRPQVVEANNVVMLLAGLENTFLLLLSVYILMRSRVVYLLVLLTRNPLLQMCFVFAVGYAFMVGVTTPNFGALVRFKIPLVPLFVSGLFITSHILDRRRMMMRAGKRFVFSSFAHGDPDRAEAIGQGPARDNAQHR